MYILMLERFIGQNKLQKGKAQYNITNKQDHTLNHVIFYYNIVMRNRSYLALSPISLFLLFKSLLEWRRINTYEHYEPNEHHHPCSLYFYECSNEEQMINGFV